MSGIVQSAQRESTPPRTDQRQRAVIRRERQDLRTMFDAVLKATIGPPVPTDRKMLAVKRSLIVALSDAYDAVVPGGDE